MCEKHQALDTLGNKAVDLTLQKIKLLFAILVQDFRVLAPIDLRIELQKNLANQEPPIGGLHDGGTIL